MDDPLPLPLLLQNKPSAYETDTKQSVETAHGTLHTFDAESQIAPSCPSFSGLRLYLDAITVNEEREILAEIEQFPFALAQSGKEKQHFGAKVNFNKRRMNAKDFHGLPRLAKWVEDRARKHIEADTTTDNPAMRALSTFKTTDYFTLRYSEKEGSNLDFHTDDRFGYGEAIIDLSLQSDSVLTFIRKRPGKDSVDCVRAALPARSIAFLYGDARFKWEHALLAYDISGTRTSVTLRTLSDELRTTEAGQDVLRRADQQIVPEP